MALILNEQENDIITTLIKEGTVTQQQLDELSAKQLQNLERIKNTVFKKIYLLDNAKRQVIILDGKGQETGKIELETASNIIFKRDEWQTWGTSVAALDEENKKVGDFYWKLEDNVGIAFSGSKAYYYNPRFEDDQYLVRQENYIYGGIPKNKVDSLPFDLYLSSDCSLLCVSDRGAGSLYLINVAENKILKTFQLRNPGSAKSLNVSISKKRNKIYVTDNQSPTLNIIDLQTHLIENKNLGMGVLGNLTLSPEEDSLYLLTTKPKQILKLIELDNYTQKKEFPLKGELFSAGDTPYDFLSTSAERKSVYLMTHIPEPDPFTPVITVIDTEKEKATQRFSLKEKENRRFSTKEKETPIGIGFAEINPLFKEKKSVLELVLDNNLADIDKIEEIKKALKEELEGPAIPPSSGGEIMEAQPGQSFAETQQQNRPKEKEIEWKITDVPHKIDNAIISPTLDEILFRKCHETIIKHFLITITEQSQLEKWENPATEIEARMTEIDKIFEKPDKDDKRPKKNKIENIVMIRLNDAIVKCRQELEWYNLSVIRLKELMKDYHFEAVFTREECLEWIRQEEMSELINAGLKTIATNCPNCDAKLLGSYSCRQCGFELEKPEEALQRKMLQIATVSPFDNLKHGHLMIIDSINKKFVEIDHFRKIVWELKKDLLNTTMEVEFENPREAIRLKNNITLIADLELKRVIKLTAKGRIFWELDQERSPEHIIDSPVSASASENGNVIIVDNGNHRILEVNEENEITWRYGQKGIDGIGPDELRFPTYFQRTAGATVLITDSGNNRVIEIEERKIIWQYGNENNSEDPIESAGSGPNQLNKPLTAWRYENDNVLILDAGNNRIIEVNQDKEIVWEYKTNEGDPETQVENPIRVYLLKTFKVLIIGETKVLEVEHDETKKVTWYSRLEDLGSATGKDIKLKVELVKRGKITHGTTNPYARKTDYEDPVEKAKREKLKEIMESKRAEANARSAGFINRSPVLLTPGAEVTEIDFLMLDKTKGVVSRVNRKGITDWIYGENNELAKPQFVYYNEPKSIFIADSDNKRVIEVDISSKEIIWSYPKTEEPDKLSYPRSVELTSVGTVLIADQIGSKVIEVNKSDNSIIWEYKDLDTLKTPVYASRLNNGNTLIVDWSTHIVLEITPDKQVAWSYGISKKAGNEEGCLSYPEYAQRLDNGNTLIVDTKNSRVIEVTPAKKVKWSYDGHGIHKLMSPTYATRMKNGNTMVIHNNNKVAIEADSKGKMLWKYMYQDKKL